jgi:hypothetical protein
MPIINSTNTSSDIVSVN